MKLRPLFRYVGHNTPILADVIYCAIADFRAGSYDAGLFLDTIARAGHGGLSYNAVANVSRDANGDAYTVQCVRPASRTASRTAEKKLSSR